MEDDIKMTIKKKLILSFTVVNILLVLITSITYFQFKTVNANYSNTIEERLNKISLSTDMIEAIYQEQLAVNSYIVDGSPTELFKLKEKSLAFKKASTTLANLSTTRTPGRQLTDKMIDLENQYSQLTNQIIELKQKNQTESIIPLVQTKVDPIINSLRQTSKELMNYQKTSLLVERDALSHEVSNTQITTLIISLIAIVLGSTLAYLIGNNIGRAIQLVSKTSEQIAKGNLIVKPVKVKNKDELGLLAKDVNQMSENLRSVIQQVSYTSEQVAASADELTASADQTNSTAKQVTISIEELAKNAETLTNNADETSHTVNEMAIGVQKVADSTIAVAASALETSRQAKIGNENIVEVINQMKSIQSSSNKTNTVIKELSNRSNQIGHIIEIISGIAKQTNLLALNASIEAARAGGHGRGFAVVADEVKQLAEQSRESAEQISELIQAIQNDTNQVVEMMKNEIDEAEEGMRLVEETGKSFHSILQSIESVTTEIEDVSAISEEMSAAVEEVNASVAEIASIIKITAESTAEIAMGSEEQSSAMVDIFSSSATLSKMSEDLREIVKRFKIN